MTAALSVIALCFRPAKQLLKQVIIQADELPPGLPQTKLVGALGTI